MFQNIITKPRHEVFRVDFAVVHPLCATSVREHLGVNQCTQCRSQ